MLASRLLIASSMDLDELSPLKILNAFHNPLNNPKISVGLLGTGSPIGLATLTLPPDLSTMDNHFSSRGGISFGVIGV